MTGITVYSTNDIASIGAPSGVIGMQVTGVSMTIAAADRSQGLTGKSVTVTFTTLTALAIADMVTINYPLGFFLAGVTTTFTQSPAAIFTTPGAVVGDRSFTVSAAAIAPIGTYTLTFTAITMGPIFGPMCGTVCGSLNAFYVVTSKDYASTMSTLGAIGGQVQNAGMTIAAADRVVGATGKTVIVTFTTQTALAIADMVTIYYPLGFFLAGATTTFTQSPAAIFTAPGAVVGDRSFTVSAAAIAPIGTYTLTFTTITMGAPMASTMGFYVATTRDCASTTTLTGVMGGIVTAPMLTIIANDRIAADNRKIVIGFMLTTALVSSDKITVTFPASFVSGTPASATTGIAATAAAITGGNVLVLTATGNIAAAASLLVTVCGLSFTQFLTSMSLPTSAVSVMTNRDYTATCTDSGMIGTAAPAVTSVSMMIPFASRIVSTAVAPVFTFTTTTNLPAATGNCPATKQNSITIGWPSGFFTQTNAVGCTAAPVLSASGALTTAGYSVALVGSTFVLTGTAAVTAGTFSVIVTGVTLNANSVVGFDDGIKVTTNLDTQGTGATGPISGYMVTAASISTCQTSTTSCQPVVITFMSTATVAAGGSIKIYFADSAGTATMPLSGVSDAFMMGSVLFNVGTIASNVLTLTSASTTGSYTFDGTSVSLALTGLQIKAASPSANADPSTIYVSMGASQMGPISNSGTVSPTGTTTKTTSLTIDKPYPGTKGARATVSFTTTNGVSTNGIVYMALPVGFFTAFSSVLSCTASTPSGMFTTTTASPCATLVASNIVTQTPVIGGKYDLITVTVTAGSLPAGANSFVLSGVNLNAGTVAATTAFKVVTTADICSLGAVTTGSISASTPGGAASSATSAVLCMALLLSSVLIMLL